MSGFNMIKKALLKKEIFTEMNDPTEWISTGSAVLNYRLTGRLDVGICNKRTALFWGQSGTGKTFLASTLCKNAQDKGYKIIYLDSEESISEDYMKKIDIDLSEEWFMPVQVDTIEEVTSALSDIFTFMEKDEKFILVIDSLAGLLSEKELAEFEKGESKGDQGQIAKKLKLMIKNINKKISQFDAFCVLVTHAYQNQDMYSTEGKWICTGGRGFQFFPSFSVLLDKQRMKDGKDIVKGVKIKGEVVKTRFTAPFQKFELEVPYDRGIDFTDGLLDVLLEEGTINKNAAWYNFDYEGETLKFQEKNFPEYLDRIMAKYEKDLIEREEYEVITDD